MFLLAAFSAAGAVAAPDADKARDEAAASPPCEVGTKESAGYQSGVANELPVKGRAPSQALHLAPCFDKDGVVRVPSFVIPQSPLISAELKAGNVAALAGTTRPPLQSIASIRKRMDEDITPMIAKARSIYAVDIKPETIAGVYTENFTPAGGVAPSKRDKVLIELHGGGFSVGARTAGRTESIPIAALAGVRVVAVDYRQGPESHYPAATEDVAAVYKELLKQYRPENIGVFGCSAGGMLTAQFVAWTQTHGLPRPGAISIACAGAGLLQGDSDHWGPPLSGQPSPDVTVQYKLEYFKGVDVNDPAVTPARSLEVLSKFPPTLLITGTRDFLLSAAAYSHTQLAKAGVESEFYAWEGMGHGYHLIVPEAPESKDTNRVIANFFLKHLGRKPARGAAK